MSAPDVPNFHDYILGRVIVDWEAKTAALDLSWWSDPCLVTAIGLQRITLTRDDDWGPSASVNGLTVQRPEGGGDLRMLVEMQSGDEIEIVCADVSHAKVLTALERRVLGAIAERAGPDGGALRQQIASATVTSRENTGAGFYTSFAVSASERLADSVSPLGDVGAAIDGLAHGMGFTLWLEDGVMQKLEGYTYDEETGRLNLSDLSFSAVGPRKLGA